MKDNINNQAFLIGNGINQAISNGVKSWSDLLKNISDAFNVDIDLSNDFKPFPLTFEEILFKSEGEFDLTLNNIKNKISEVFENTPSNILHSELVNSGIENILTTNYDYAFEKAYISGFENEKEFTSKSTEETLNSIKRRTIFKDKKNSPNIWHIHGEIKQRLYPYELKKTSRANSIMIGYEHYGAYLVEIQKYIKGDKGKKDKSIIDKIDDDNYKPLSWIDFFFMGELHIAGISYDFSEQHLWWLLNYRAKQIKKKKIKKINDIYYYYTVTDEVDPEGPTKYIKQLIKKNVNKAKIDLFNALGVKPVSIKIKIGDYESYYKQIFSRILL